MPEVTRSLTLATTNRKKCAELGALLAPLGIALRSLADLRAAPLDVDEDGDTFAANACKKAREQARHLGAWVLAEDSGLAVDALDGAPGVYSARYSGPDASDESNNDRLLRALDGVPTERRTAHYVCHIAVAGPDGTIRADSEARCNGRITTERRGTAGFGYDPLFEIVEYHRTFGELGPHVKAAISHRARAVYQLMPQLRRLIASGAWT